MSEFQFSQEAAQKAITTMDTVSSQIEKTAQELETVISNAQSSWACDSATSFFGELVPKVQQLNKAVVAPLSDHLRLCYSNYFHTEIAASDQMEDVMSMFLPG